LKATAEQEPNWNRNRSKIKGDKLDGPGKNWTGKQKCGPATAAKIALNWRQPLNAIYQTDDRDSHTQSTQQHTARAVHVWRLDREGNMPLRETGRYSKVERSDNS